MKPKLFIGSSKEALAIADAIHENFQYDAEVTVWNQGVFEPSQVAVDSLLKTLEGMDFGVFVFAPDDTVFIRREENVATRDNVVLELGFYIGRLGRERSFIVLPREHEGHRIPTDLLGVTPTAYETGRSDDNYVSSTGPACAAIRRQIKTLGPRPGGGRAQSSSQDEGEEVGISSREVGEPAVPDRAETDLDAEAPKPTSRAAYEYISDMVAALSRDDTERGEEAYKQARDAESDPDKKLHIEALYHFVRYRRGDSVALDHLQDLAEQAKDAPKILHVIYDLLGSAYDLADDFQNAIKAYESAAEAAQSEEQRARYVAALARCLFESGDGDEAFEKLMVEIENVKDRTALSTLYRGLASLYEQTDNSELRAVALQKATEYKPSDTRLRFDTGFDPLARTDQS